MTKSTKSAFWAEGELPDPNSPSGFRRVFFVFTPGSHPAYKGWVDTLVEAKGLAKDVDKGNQIRDCPPPKGEFFVYVNGVKHRAHLVPDPTTRALGLHGPAADAMKSIGEKLAARRGHRAATRAPASRKKTDSPTP